jgi:hypothetical protein
MFGESFDSSSERLASASDDLSIQLAEPDDCWNYDQTPPSDDP